MKLNFIFLAILTQVALFSQVNAHTSGKTVGNICKTAFKNITFQCVNKKTCLCEEYQRRSFVYCAMSHTDDKDELKAALKTLRKNCRKVKMSVLKNDTKYAAKEVREVTFADLHKKKINFPIVVPEENYRYAGKCVRAWDYHYHTSDNMAGGIAAYWAFVMLLQIIFNIVQNYLPRVMNAFDTRVTRSIRKYFILPGTFGHRHTTVSSFMGYKWITPTRLEALIVAGHVIIGIVISCTNYPLIADSWYKIPDKTRQLQNFLAWRSGIFAIMHVPLLFLFAGRNNFMMWLTGWSIDRFNLFHRWIARTMMAHTIVHAAAYAIAYHNSSRLQAAWKRTYWLHGFAATIFGAVLIVHSVYYLRSRFYEIFLIVHIILAAAFTATCYYHVYYLHGGTEYMWASVAVWLFDRLARIGRIFVSGVNSKAETKLYPDDIIKMKIDYSNIWKFKAGQYLFIHVMRWKYFYQSHPFSVIQSPLPEDKGKLVLLFKVRNGFSKTMRKELEMQQTRSITYRLLIDGPYGEEKPVHNYDNIALIAGGIGITGVYSYATELLAKPSNKRISLIWCISDESALEWFKEELEFLAQDERFDVRVHIKTSSTMIENCSKEEDEKKTAVDVNNAPSSISSHSSDEEIKQRLSNNNVQIYYGRLKTREVLGEEIKASIGTVAVVCCGPGPLNDDVRHAVVDSIDKAKSRVDYFEESFSW